MASVDTTPNEQVDVGTSTRLASPDMFDLVMYNDDVTPMEFVVMVLVQVLSLAQEEAVELMLAVHNSGKAICGTFVEDIAIDYRDRIVESAVEHRYPLLCEVEPSAVSSGTADD